METQTSAMEIATGIWMQTGWLLGRTPHLLQNSHYRSIVEVHGAKSNTFGWARSSSSFNDTKTQPIFPQRRWHIWCYCCYCFIKRHWECTKMSPSECKTRLLETLWHSDNYKQSTLTLPSLYFNFFLLLFSGEKVTLFNRGKHCIIVSHSIKIEVTLAAVIFKV